MSVEISLALCTCRAYVDKPQLQLCVHAVRPGTHKLLQMLHAFTENYAQYGVYLLLNLSKSSFTDDCAQICRGASRSLDAPSSMCHVSLLHP